MAVFLLPLCCIGQRRIFVEKVFVITICSVAFLYSSNYFDARIGGLSRHLAPARNLLQQIPEGKRLFPIRVSGPFVGHIEAFYVIDKNGYVPTLFSAPYMIVKYREEPSFTPDIHELSDEMVSKYDYAIVWGFNDKLIKHLNNIHFDLVDKYDDIAIYKNLLLTQ
jgi:hypothetical protein